jgi:hypothetical protein
MGLTNPPEKALTNPYTKYCWRMLHLKMTLRFKNYALQRKGKIFVVMGLSENAGGSNASLFNSILHRHKGALLGKM